MRVEISQVLVVLAGCGAAIPELPSKGGPAWTELTSDHFTLWTDAAIPQATALIQGMEDLREAETGVAFHGVSPVGRSFVIALADRDELHAFVPTQFEAYAATMEGAFSQPMIVLAASDDVTTGIAAHELTHVISHSVMRYQPRWFSEGMAKYFETIRIDHASGSVIVGAPPVEAPLHRLMPLRSMLECNEVSCLDAGFYATAWAVYTFLSNVHPDDLAKLERGMQETHGDPTAAWHDVFGTQTAEIEGELYDWLDTGRHLELRYHSTFHDWPVTQRVLRDADVDAVRGLLHWIFGRPLAATTEVHAALAADPTNVLARLVSVAVGLPISVAEARALVKAHDDDWRAWFLLFHVVAGDEQSMAHAEVCGLLAENPVITPPLKCPP